MHQGESGKLPTVKNDSELHMKRVIPAIVVAYFVMLGPSPLPAQCPETLLWTNGTSLWAYRAVQCDQQDCTSQATDKVLVYGSELNQTGCVREGDACKCQASDIQPVGAGTTIEADLPIQNRSCQTLDSFVVQIGNDYIQCVEFRYVPDQSHVDDFGQAVARNMRLSMKLSAKPERGTTDLLVGDSARLDDDKVVRTIGDLIVTYPMLTSGELTLEQLATQQTTEPAQAPDDEDSQERPGPDNTAEEAEVERPGPDDDSD